VRRWMIRDEVAGLGGDPGWIEEALRDLVFA
jgi:hypothetical protein